jgi:hypothetical protein
MIDARARPGAEPGERLKERGSRGRRRLGRPGPVRRDDLATRGRERESRAGRRTGVDAHRFRPSDRLASRASPGIRRKLEGSFDARGRGPGEEP